MERQSEALSLGPIDIPNWFILSQPLAFIVFMISAVAETNRLPFDLPEAETGARRRIPHRVFRIPLRSTSSANTST